MLDPGGHEPRGCACVQGSQAFGAGVQGFEGAGAEEESVGELGRSQGPARGCGRRLPSRSPGLEQGQLDRGHPSVEIIGANRLDLEEVDGGGSALDPIFEAQGREHLERPLARSRRVERIPTHRRMEFCRCHSLDRDGMPARAQ